MRFETPIRVRFVLGDVAAPVLRAASALPRRARDAGRAGDTLARSPCQQRNGSNKRAEEPMQHSLHTSLPVEIIPPIPKPVPLPAVAPFPSQIPLRPIQYYPPSPDARAF